MEISIPHYAVDYTFMAMDGNRQHPRGEFWTETVECNETGYVSRSASKYNSLGNCRYRTVFIGRSVPHLTHFVYLTIKEEYIVAKSEYPNKMIVMTTIGTFTLYKPEYKQNANIWFAESVEYDR